jgi:hypothetical protein
MEGNFCGQRGLARIQKKNQELQTMQVIKMATHTLIEKTAFSHYESTLCNEYVLIIFFKKMNSPQNIVLTCVVKEILNFSKSLTFEETEVFVLFFCYWLFFPLAFPLFISI